MPTIRSGGLGTTNRTASTRLRQGKLIDGPPGPRASGTRHHRSWEICPGCGDDPSWDWSESPPELRKVRSVYATAEDAREALMEHLGMQH
jgi:hypothetical protein